VKPSSAGCAAFVVRKFGRLQEGLGGRAREVGDGVTPRALSYVRVCFLFGGIDRADQLTLKVCQSFRTEIKGNDFSSGLAP